MNDDTIIAIDPKNASQMRVMTPTKYGTVDFTIGGEDSEFVQAEGDFTYRGRTYPGKILLKRDTLTPANGYRWMLKNERGETASWSVYNGISGEVTKAVLETLRAHPEILTRAEHVSLAAELMAAQYVADRLAEQLVAARLREDDLRAELKAIADSRQS